MDFKWQFFVCTHLCLLIAAFSVQVCPAAEGGDIEALRHAAKAEIAKEKETETEQQTFTSGALGLQKLNPEISVTGDLLWSYTDSQTTDKKSDFLFRGLGIHAEAYLDPYTRFKAAFSVSENDTQLGEAYMTRFGIMPNVNLTLGKFRQQFGVVNRWHKHGLDQVDFPLALRQIFGPAGLNQTGGSLNWIMPEMFRYSQEALLQVTDAENRRVFAENTDNNPSILGRYKLYKDMTASTYAEIGFSGLWGRNNQWTVSEETIDRKLGAWVFGADLTILWEPTKRMRYRNVTWRTEAYALEKDILASNGWGEDTINAWGGYSSLESKISRTVILGIRGDYFEPDVKPYASAETVNLAPLAVADEGAHRWQAGPYVTWYQSPFVHFRAEYNRQDGSGTGPEEDVFWLQCVFAAGPHKHERY